MSVQNMKSISQMEEFARGEDDQCCNFRLRSKGFTNSWLCCKVRDGVAVYSHNVGRGEKPLTAQEAQAMMDNEWLHRYQKEGE